MARLFRKLLHNQKRSASKPARYWLNHFSQVQSKHDDKAIAPYYCPRVEGIFEKNVKNLFCSVNLNLYGTILQMVKKANKMARLFRKF